MFVIMHSLVMNTFLTPFSELLTKLLNDVALVFKNLIVINKYIYI